MSRIIHDNKHLSLNDRKIIEQGIENRCNKVDIARTLGKDPTTIAKEIRLHREFNLEIHSIIQIFVLILKNVVAVSLNAKTIKSKLVN